MRRLNHVRRTPGIPFWQRNYWEHIIRNEDSLNRIREYIQTNHTLGLQFSPSCGTIEQEAHNPNKAGLVSCVHHDSHCTQS